MKKLAITTASALVALAAAATFAGAAEDDVSPELARKAAVGMLKTSPNESRLDTGYPLQVSEPREYYSYDGNRKYYVVYTYFGPGDIPTWEQLERKPKRETEYFHCFIIPATKKEMPNREGHVNIPLTIRRKVPSEEILKGKFPGQPYEYVKTVIHASSTFFVFNVKGRDVFVDADWGHVYPASDSIGMAAPPDEIEYQRMTKEAWDKVDSVDVSEYFNSGP